MTIYHTIKCGVPCLVKCNKGMNTISSHRNCQTSHINLHSDAHYIQDSVWMFNYHSSVSQHYASQLHLPALHINLHTQGIGGLGRLPDEKKKTCLNVKGGQCCLPLQKYRTKEIIAEITHLFCMVTVEITFFLGQYFCGLKKK